MAEYNNITRAALARARVEERNAKIRHLPEREQTLVKGLTEKGVYSDAVSGRLRNF